LIAVSTLEALAQQLPFSPFPVCPIIDSRRGEIFTALFQWDTHQHALKRIMKDKCAAFEDLPGILPGPTAIIGNDFRKQAPILRKCMGANAVLAPPEKWHVGAAAIAELGSQRLGRGENDDLETITPVYFRPPDIRPNPYPLLKRAAKNE
jgi:tRNA threonylcarbamoyladenosine biosynthesis protein TsaB